MEINTLILAGAVGFVGSTIKDLPKNISSLLVYSFGYNISVSSNSDKAYDRVNEYIINNLHSSIIKRKAKFGIRYEDCSQKTIMSLGLGTFYLYENGNIYIINHFKEEKKHFEEYQINISIIGRSAKYTHSKIINYSTTKNNADKIGVRLGYTYKGIPNRLMDTIYCNDGVKDKIITEIDNFNNKKNVYKQNGVPYRIGLLLYGLPGTGKTSMVKAIATYTKRDINAINLNDLKDLSNVLERVSENEILLIEEIDTVVENRDEESKKNIELGNLLNLLDGVGTPENLIIIATTNHIERLDDALIRAGRFDVKVELGYLSKKEIENILYSKNMELNDNMKFPMAPSDLQSEILKQLV